METFQSHKISRMKKKKLKQKALNFTNDSKSTFDTKQNVPKPEKNYPNSFKKKKLNLQNKSHFKDFHNQKRSIKQFKDKLKTNEVNRNPNLFDGNISNKNKKIHKNISESSSLPRDIFNASSKELNKKKIKKTKLENNVGNIKNLTSQETPENNDLTEKKKNQNKKKVMKKRQIMENADDIQKPQNNRHKKLKKSKNFSSEVSEISSEDSEDDIEIRKELQNSSIYKEIQKLLKENLSLSCGLSDDDSVRNIEEGTSPQNSDESSASESIEIEESTSKSVNNLAKVKTEMSFERTPRTKESIKSAAKDPVVNLSKEKKSLIRDPVNNSDKLNASKSLRNKAQVKLQAAKFRFLNEKLYTENGKDSFAYFQANQDEFQDYHMGYNLQVSKWPMNPVDKIISSLQNAKKNYAIADMGCGDAKIARTLTNCTVHSYDLIALNEYVTPCNISKVPLPSESVDIVVFCLSLMGTNWKDYLREAHRITKFGGYLKIAEVESRIENLDLFIKNVQCLGFSLENKNVEHKIFVFLDFKKDKKKKTKKGKVEDIVLKPCLYKKR